MRTGWLIFLLLVNGLLVGQDVHFSHFFHTPTLLNPAQTGAFDGSLRLGGNARQQWQSVTVPYRTVGAWGDYRFTLADKWSAGAGLIALYDQAGDGRLTTQKQILSGSIHYQASRKLAVALGLGIGMVQKQLDYSRLVFDNQWTTKGFVNTNPSGEPFTGEERLNYRDWQGGVLISGAPNESLNWYAGASVLHATRPAESFYGSQNQIGLRPVFQAGARLQLNPQWQVEPALLYMAQRGAEELLLGLQAGYVVNAWLPQQDESPTMLLAGLWVRAVGDVIPSVGLQYGKIRGVLSYDINLGQSRTASNLRGGTELSVVYILQREKSFGKVVIPCFRF